MKRFPMMQDCPRPKPASSPALRAQPLILCISSQARYDFDFVQNLQQSFDNPQDNFTRRLPKNPNWTAPFLTDLTPLAASQTQLLQSTKPQAPNPHNSTKPEPHQCPIKSN